MPVFTFGYRARPNPEWLAEQMAAMVQPRRRPQPPAPLFEATP